MIIIKNKSCLLKTIPLVLEEFQKVHFLIMGYPNVERYRRQAEELGVADHVTLPLIQFFCGFFSRKAPGDLAVSPKLAETESNGKLCNYMACGLATVAFDTPVNREILGEWGVYARLGEAASLAEAILGLLGDEERVKELGRRLRRRAVERFSWDDTARRLMECYRDLVP